MDKRIEEYRPCQELRRSLEGLLVLVFAGLPLAARAAAPSVACDQRVPAEQAMVYADRALGAFSRPTPTMSTDFLLAREDLWRALPCLADPLSPSQAAAVHLIEGLHAWLREAPDQTYRSFWAAYASNPPFRLPSTLSVPGSELADVEVRAMGSGPPARRAIEGAEGRGLVVDGKLSNLLPTELPAVVQGLSQDEVTGAQATVWTVYHLPGDPLPTFSSAPAEAARGARWRGVTGGLACGAGVAGGVAGALGLVARAKGEDAVGAGGEVEDLDGMKRAVRLYAGAAGVGGAAVGLAGAALVVRLMY